MPRLARIRSTVLPSAASVLAALSLLGCPCPYPCPCHPPDDEDTTTTDTSSTSESTTGDDSTTDSTSTGDTSTGDTTTGGSGLLVPREPLEIPRVLQPITADLDGDSADDVVIGMMVAFAAVAGADRTDPFYHPAGDVHAHRLAVPDLDGDGDSDIVAAQLGASGTRLSSVRRTDSGFADIDVIDLAPCFNPMGLAVGDLDGDAIDDAAVGCLNPGVVIARGLGDGVFADPSLVALDGNPAGVLLADVLGDAALDLIAFDQSSAGVLVYAGTGDLAFEFAAAQTFPTPLPHVLTSGDLDGDGDDDYLALVDLPSVCMPFFAEAGGLVAGEAAPCGPYPIDAKIGDFDGDGLGDLAALQFVNGLPGALHVMRGHGDGSFAAPDIYETGFNTWSLALGDYSGDTRLDVVVVSEDLVTYFDQVP